MTSSPLRASLRLLLGLFVVVVALQQDGPLALGSALVGSGVALGGCATLLGLERRADAVAEAIALLLMAAGAMSLRPR